jgi:3-phenylpropionate/trans-cinnamate dioxygenase ferredoxin reductase component
VVGGGYIGLEVAALAREHGLAVTVVEMAERLMARVVCPEVSTFYRELHARAGVELLLGTPVLGFAGRQQVETVHTGAGDLAADLVIVGIGIVPVTELAQAAGLACEDGICVDEYARTSHPEVFAAGDCTRHPNALLGRRLRLESVHNALEQARTAAATLCGEDRPYNQVPWFWSDQYETKLQIAGLAEHHDQVVLRGDPASGSFSACYLRGDALVALDAVNGPRDFMQAKKLLAQGARVDPARLADPAIALPDTVMPGGGD